MGTHVDIIKYRPILYMVYNSVQWMYFTHRFVEFTYFAWLNSRENRKTLYFKDNKPVDVFNTILSIYCPKNNHMQYFSIYQFTSQFVNIIIINNWMFLLPK